MPNLSPPAQGQGGSESTAGEAPNPYVHFSPRQREVLTWLLKAASEKEIAHKLRISVNTVHQHVTQVYRLAGVSGRAELLVRMLGQGPGVQRQDAEQELLERLHLVPVLRERLE
jgi:DNA-binding CsgD family transcriptional regulator